MDESRKKGNAYETLLMEAARNHLVGEPGDIEMHLKGIDCDILGSERK